MSTLLATVSPRGQGHRAIDSLPKVSQLLSCRGGIQVKWVWGQRPGAQREHLSPSHTPYYWSQGGVIPDPGALSHTQRNSRGYLTFLKKRLCCFPLTSSFLGPWSRNATVRNESWLFLKTKSQSHKQSWSIACYPASTLPLSGHLFAHKDDHISDLKRGTSRFWNTDYMRGIILGVVFWINLVWFKEMIGAGRTLGRVGIWSRPRILS